MALYSFFCAEDHETEHFSSRENRPDEVACRTCQQAATYRLTVAKDSRWTSRSTNLSDYRGLALHDFRCNECGERFEEIIDFSEGESAHDGQDCPQCGSHAGWVPSVKIDRWSEQFPYFDRGLGVMLKSKAHRRQVCKERGLTPVEGDYDVEREYSKWDTRVAQETSEYEDYCDKLDNHPAFKEFRRAEDQGRV